MTAYTDFLTYQFVDNPASIPNDWPAYTKTVVDEQDPIDPNWQRLSDDDFHAYITDPERVGRFDAAQLAYENSKILKITELVDEGFIDLPTYKIDFRRHLKDGVILAKTVIMSQNGRPLKSEYKYNGELIADIVFEFETNSFNLVTRRKEKLGYYNKNGDVLNYYTISDESWDLSQTYYLARTINERYAARFKVFDEIKAYINAIMLSTYLGQGLTYENVLTDGYNFWKEYSSDIDAWLHIGASGPFVDRITNDSVFAFLNFEISPNISIRDWIITRVTY